MHKIISCTCKHEAQNKMYGKGKRVHNPCNAGHRCTVCLHEVKDNPADKKK